MSQYSVMPLKCSTLLFRTALIPGCSVWDYGTWETWERVLLMGQRRQARLSHRGTSYFCALPWLQDRLILARYRFVCGKIVATWSKTLVLGDAAYFMNCCCIVRTRELAALLGCVTSVFATKPTSSSITVSILNLFFISLLLSLPVTHICSRSLLSLTLSPLQVFHLSICIPVTPWYIPWMVRN